MRWKSNLPRPDRLCPTNSDRIATLTAEVVAAKAEISPPASVNHMDSGDEDNQSFQSSEDQMLEENEFPEEYEPVREGLKTEKDGGQAEGQVIRTGSCNSGEVVSSIAV